jgi:hypothetical protein
MRLYDFVSVGNPEGIESSMSLMLGCLRMKVWLNLVTQVMIHMLQGTIP